MRTGCASTAIRPANRSQQQLFSPAPIYDDLERVKLADSLSLLVERRGGDDPLVQQVLDGQGPRRAQPRN